MVNERLGYVPLQAVVEVDAIARPWRLAQVQDTLLVSTVFFKQDKPLGRYSGVGLPFDGLAPAGSYSLSLSLCVYI